MTEYDAAALDLVRRRVINVVGHELRTPVTTIRGLADLMVDAPDDELRSVLVPALVRNAERAERLLDDLLVAGGVTTANSTEAPEAVDLGALVADIAAGTNVQIIGRPEGSVIVRPGSARRAIQNLVDDADHYSDGTPSIRFESDPTSVTMVVTTPVDREVPDLDLGFELFFRGEIAVTRAPGLGVGLPVARTLARLDGGDLTLAQTPGSVEAHLRLPRAA